MAISYDKNSENSLGFLGNNLQPTNGKRLRINVSGMRFETYESTFERFPETLLGCFEKRIKFYDPVTDEYRLNRDKHTFDAILFYYQSPGILRRPEHISIKMFAEELEFYEINNVRSLLLESEVKQDVTCDKSIRGRMWQLLEKPESSKCARYLSFVSISIIVLSLITFCMETMPELNEEGNGVDKTITNKRNKWFVLECVWICWFTLELALRLISAPNRMRFILSPFGLIDMVAVAPFYITLLMQIRTDANSFAVLRAVRVGRCLRLFKITRYNSYSAIFAAAIRDSQSNLRMLSLAIVITVLFFSSSIYYVEEFGEGVSQFTSIPDTFYYTIITMVTVGYGDYVPRTVFGRFLGTWCAFSGIVVLYCLPTPLIVMRFVQLYKEKVVKDMVKSNKDTKEILRQFDENVFSKPIM